MDRIKKEGIILQYAAKTQQEYKEIGEKIKENIEKAIGFGVSREDIIRCVKKMDFSSAELHDRCEKLLSDKRLRRLSIWRQEKPSDEIISVNNAVTGYFSVFQYGGPSPKTKAVAEIAAKQVTELAVIIRKWGDTWDGLPVVEFDIEAEIKKKLIAGR